MALFGRPSAGDDQRAQAWRDWVRQRHPLAIASMVLGIFSFIEFGQFLLFGIAGVVLGTIALRQLRRRAADPSSDDPASDPASDVASPPFGQRLAWTGIVLSAVSLVIAIVLLAHRRQF